MRYSGSYATVVYNNKTTGTVIYQQCCPRQTFAAGRPVCLRMRQLTSSLDVGTYCSNKDIMSSETAQENARLHQDVEGLAMQLQQRDDQLESSYRDQNELLLRLEEAHNELMGLQEQNESLQNEMQSMFADREACQRMYEDERMSRIAAEKALESSQAYLEKTVSDVQRLSAERDAVRAELNAQHKKIVDLEEDIILASRDAKENLHREMEALADVEYQKDECATLRSENDKLRTKIIELQSQISMKSDEESIPAPKKRGRPKKMQPIIDYSDAVDAAQVAQDAALEAKKQSYKIRAEAALLVETVEDRAIELVEKAQKEVAMLKAELEKVRSSDDE